MIYEYITNYYNTYYIDIILIYTCKARILYAPRILLVNGLSKEMLFNIFSFFNDTMCSFTVHKNNN